MKERAAHIGCARALDLSEAVERVLQPRERPVRLRGGGRRRAAGNPARFRLFIRIRLGRREAVNSAVIRHGNARELIRIALCRSDVTAPVTRMRATRSIALEHEARIRRGGRACRRATTRVMP
jgi:hypothetical protein